MRTKYTLAKVYSDAFLINQDNLSLLENFFVHTLKIPNRTWEHIVEEIKDARIGVA